MVDEKNNDTCDFAVVENIKQDANAVEMKIKQNEESVCEKTNKRSRKKWSKSKSPRKRKNPLKKGSGGFGLFTRLANPNKQKKHPGIIQYVI